MGAYSPTGGFPATIAAGATVNFTFPTVNQNAFAAGVKMDQAGNLTIQRYLDSAGLIPIGAAVTVGVVANVAVTVNVADGVPCNFIKLSIQNTSGVVANLAAVALVAGAH